MKKIFIVKTFTGRSVLNALSKRHWSRFLKLAKVKNGGSAAGLVLVPAVGSDHLYDVLEGLGGVATPKMLSMVQDEIEAGRLTLNDLAWLPAAPKKVRRIKE